MPEPTEAATVACKNCGEPIQPGMFSEWVHVIGPGSVLYRCDPAKSGKPYGLNAEVSEPDAAGLIACKIVGTNSHHSMQMWSAYCSCGWSTVQRDPRWRDDAVLKHLAAGADERRKTPGIPDSIEDLIERSSLGTPDAKALREQADPALVERVMERVRESCDEQAGRSEVDPS